MSEENLRTQVGKGFDQFTNPTMITAALVGAIINADFTKDLVRRVIVDPVSQRFIPHITFQGYNAMRECIWTLYKLFPDFTILNILGGVKTNVENVKEAMDDAYENCNIYRMYISSDKNNIAELHRVGKSAIYVTGRMDYDKNAFKMQVYFISMTHKLKDLWDKTYEDVIYNFGKGMTEKNSRRVRVLQFDDARPSKSVCDVPTTIIMDHVQDDLDGVVSMVQKSDEISKAYKINKTVGVLLYGPHGTGKSTIARYLAMILERTLILTNSDNLFSAVNYVKNHAEDDDKFILLIEDIDFHFVDRRNTKKDDASKDMMSKTETLFQILDGVLASNNLMIIATTNYIDRLDPALIRDGRFDFRLEVTGLTYADAAKVCERFDITPEEIRLREWATPIPPSSLQTVILQHKTKITKHTEIPKNLLRKKKEV